MFSPRLGEISKAKGSQDVAMIDGNYEDRRPRVNPKCDFPYIGQPLLRNHDIVDPSANDPVSYHFEYRSCFGFVKCVFKLTDGWEGPFEYEAGDKDKKDMAKKLEEVEEIVEEK